MKLAILIIVTIALSPILLPLSLLAGIAGACLDWKPELI